MQGRACSTHLQPPKLAGQVQRGFLRLVDEARVGLVLEQHLRLQGSNVVRGSASPCSLLPTQHSGVCPLPVPQRAPWRARRRLWALTYHLVVAVLCREVQRDLPVQRGHVDGGGGAEQHPHGLHAALPRRVVQGPHPCGQRGSAGPETAPSLPQGAELAATGAVPGVTPYRCCP